eukprot:TRINITY_DN1923_c0_g1_i2.p2 TRINITY_DN1923_c0_g1~~TRINITY_DN1923_c0_g1_i2.p2  ORF type:complete len:318 (+),score=108.63 TRINITY_DN1923_c0_g1_i2:1160-2113(+)
MALRFAPAALRRQGRRRSGAASYENYLRLLQTQVVKEGTLLLEAGKKAEETGGDLVVPETMFVSYNQLAAMEDCPKDPVLRFRDLDNIRVLCQASGSSHHVKDQDCCTLVMDLLEEVKRGRRLTKDIVAIFDKMEAHPDFYRVRDKAYNVMIYNTLAREYPALETPARLYGNLLEKEGKASAWTYVCLARVQMFLPPIERAPYREAFLAEIDSAESGGHITPYEARNARMLVRHLKWITDGARLTMYITGLVLTISLFFYAVAFRAQEREKRDLVEHEMFTIMDEKYYGESTRSEGGRTTSVPSGRAGIKRVQDVEE